MATHTFDTIVAYDISDNRRRKKVFDRLADFGLINIQYSLFWGRLMTSELRSTERFLKEVIKEDQGDRVIVLTGQFTEQLQTRSVGYPGEDWQEKTHVIL